MNMDMNGYSYGPEANGYNYGSEDEYDNEYVEEIEYENMRRAEEKERVLKEKERLESEIQAEKLKNELHVVSPFLNWAKAQAKIVVEKLSFEDPDKDWTQVKKNTKKNNLEEPVKKVVVDTTKTEICKYILKKEKCAYKNCRYAHSIIELNVVECNYGSGCKAVRFDDRTCKYVNDGRKDKVCMRIHPKETKENFYSRVNKFIPVTNEEMDMAYDCILEFQEKNSDYVENMRQKAIILPSNMSVQYKIDTPYYDIKAIQWGTMEPVKLADEKIVKKIVKPFFAKTKPAPVVVKPAVVTDGDKIKKIERQIQELQEKIKNNNVIFDRFAPRIEVAACQKHCEKITLENQKINSDIDKLNVQIEKIKNPPVAAVKKVEVKKVEAKIEIKKVEVVFVKKFDTSCKSFRNALGVVSNEPSQLCCENKTLDTVENKIEAKVCRLKTEMCKSYGKYVCPLGNNCNFAHNFDELNILACPYGSKCYDIYCSSGEYFNRNNYKNRVCNKKHPEETKENIYKRIGYCKIPAVSKNVETFDNRKTVLCNSVIGKYICHLGNNCKFAHNNKELKILPCAYGDNCFDIERCSGVYINKNNTKRVCNKKHSSETTENVHKRLGL